MAYDVIHMHDDCNREMGRLRMERDKFRDQLKANYETLKAYDALVKAADNVAFVRRGDEGNLDSVLDELRKALDKVGAKR